MTHEGGADLSKPLTSNIIRNTKDRNNKAAVSLSHPKITAPPRPIANNDAVNFNVTAELVFDSERLFVGVT